MRIIAGDWKGKNIEMPKGNRLRPTTEKVKEAIFSMIMPWTAEGICVDLFAGTGNLGLEALSRGMDKCYFSDNNEESITLIKKNIANCRGEKYSKLLKFDYAHNIELIRRDLGENEVDVIFLDPPYDSDLYKIAFEKIRQSNILSEKGIVVGEHRKENELANKINGFRVLKNKEYGSIGITIYSINMI